MSSINFVDYVTPVPAAWLNDINNLAYHDVAQNGTKLYNRINTIVDVKDFGAIGDGVTDDTTSIQNCINYANSLVTNLPGQDPIGGVTITLNGNFKVTSPLVLNTSNICISGSGGSSILVYFNSVTGYNGAAPVFIIGSGKDWQTSGSISNVTKYNRISNIEIKRVTGYDSFIGVLVSGTRNARVENVMVEKGFIGLLLENTSEFTSNQVSCIGCTYGVVGDNRGNRAASYSVLNVACTDNDVSSVNMYMSTVYYPQQTGFLLINTGTFGINGATIGQFSTNGTASPGLNYPSSAVGIHYYGDSVKWTRGAYSNNIVFEASNTVSSTCIKFESINKNCPILGVTIDNCQVQTFASDYTNNKVTTFIDVQQTVAQISDINIRNSGFTYQTSGYYYGIMCNINGYPIINFDNCYPTISFGNSNIGYYTSISNSVELEHVNTASFVPSGWTTEGTTTGCSSIGGSSGNPSYLHFTGDTGAMGIYKKFVYRESIQHIGSAYVSFLVRGNADLVCYAVINGSSGSASNVINSTTIPLYSNSVLTKSVNSSSTWQRVGLFFNPSSVNYGFDNVTFHIGRAANATSNTFIDIQDISIGYIKGGYTPYNVFV